MKDRHMLFMIMLGCKPEGRHTEQHDIFFGIGNEVKDLIPVIKAFWPDAGEIHFDAYQNITQADGYDVTIIPVENSIEEANKQHLFFINLGGYTKNIFDEQHYKMLVAAPNMDAAKKKAKDNPFFKQYDQAHIDDKYAIDVDDIYKVETILPAFMQQKYRIQLSPAALVNPSPMALGYFQMHLL